MRLPHHVGWQGCSRGFGQHAARLRNGLHGTCKCALQGDEAVNSGAIDNESNAVQRA